MRRTISISWARYEKEQAEYQAKFTAGEKDLKQPTAPERNLKWEALGKVLTGELKARIHAHRADDMLTAIRIAEEFHLDLAIEHATEGYKIAEILAEKGIPVIVGPVLMDRPKYEMRGLDPRNPGILSKAGVKVAIQTDASIGCEILIDQCCFSCAGRNAGRRSSQSSHHLSGRNHRCRSTCGQP